MVEPGRDRTIELTLKKFSSGGLSGEEATELAALNAQVVVPVLDGRNGRDEE